MLREDLLDQLSKTISLPWVWYMFLKYLGRKHIVKDVRYIYHYRIIGEERFLFDYTERGINK